MLCTTLAALHCLLTAATVADVSAWPDEAYRKQWACDMEGVVTAVKPECFVLQDDTGRTLVYTYNYKKDSPRPGDRIKVCCRGLIDDAKRNIILLKQFTTVEHGEVPPPEETTVTRIMRGEHDLATVRVRGFVTAVVPDEIQQSNMFLLLGDGRDVVEMAVARSRNPEKLVGAEVEVTGLCHESLGSWRIFQGRGIVSIDGYEYIKVITPPPEDPFSAPPLGAATTITAHNIAALGRRSAIGRVLATWHGDCVMLSGEKYGRWTTFQATLANGQTLPKCGEVVQVVGFPRTDLFNITLDNALCRAADDSSASPAALAEKPMDVTAETLLTSRRGDPQVQVLNHGQTIRIRGRVRSVPMEDFNENRMQIQSGEHMVPVDVSSCPEAVANVTRDCEVEVTGVCLLMADAWRADMPIPHVRGFAVVVRDAHDVRVVARPPWWTPVRLFVVICALLLAVVAFLVWNWLLRRLVARRSRELLRTEIKKAESDLRIGERTMLAAELHDAISQTLTGVSLQVDAAADTMKSDLPAAEHFLSVARQTLLSCREELRRCLWDLRNNALEDSDFEETLRRAIRPSVGAAKVSVDFDVRRSRMSDSTAHSILCIVRELCVNAARHGGAENIKVDGAEDNGNIRLSVKDDGCGFDPAKRPGPADGHFGLQGVRERVARLSGSLAIDSAPGKGAKVSVSLKPPAA
ncbi:MAG: sensor histidine kinase [Kiritimatiellae bacterium]|nr:sensor histidine kinase [Kiritimatiellia bacterium]